MADSHGRIGASHLRLIGNQRTCGRNEKPALPIEQQRKNCSFRPASREPHVGHPISGRDNVGPVLGKLSDYGWIKIQRLGDHIDRTVRQPIEQ